ncbi:MAG: hypothetical protein A2X23_11485 [Chloroflexi bacterium GWC2_73_18]|nr:MAG: hypothetical protein A2X23_11485 [Chloroflexi bacterium GWC2_73_18]
MTALRAAMMPMAAMAVPQSRTRRPGRAWPIAQRPIVSTPRMTATRRASRCGPGRHSTATWT